jgi:hypothetical protein
MYVSLRAVQSAVHYEYLHVCFMNLFMKTINDAKWILQNMWYIMIDLFSIEISEVNWKIFSIEGKTIGQLIVLIT